MFFFAKRDIPWLGRRFAGRKLKKIKNNLNLHHVRAYILWTIVYKQPKFEQYADQVYLLPSAMDDVTEHATAASSITVSDVTDSFSSPSNGDNFCCRR